MGREGHLLEGRQEYGECEQQKKNRHQIGADVREIGLGRVVVVTAKGAVLFLALAVVMVVQEPVGGAHEDENHHDGQR
jgi:hypothetical protein